MRTQASHVKSYLEDYQELRREDEPFGAISNLAYAEYFVRSADGKTADMVTTAINAARFKPGEVQRAIAKAKAELLHLEALVAGDGGVGLLVEELHLLVSLRTTLGLFASFVIKYLGQPMPFDLSAVDHEIYELRGHPRTGRRLNKVINNVESNTGVRLVGTAIG